ncbi:hypothetical protein EC973_002525 [Apophysomyces ossiformis]|uniref:Uncharacterized protein n=1 Tax=Apophysomyces ossiformis TaxID=679940 RepID=A0A8H7BYB3_9FUNG|nr:hypothetical protein EC973_002525 [Apophysomyces ossiformis]
MGIPLWRCLQPETEKRHHKRARRLPSSRRHAITSLPTPPPPPPPPARRQAAMANLLLSSSRLQDSELDRRVQSRLNEKEDLLGHLERTVHLLDQFLSARSALGSDIVAMPSFLLQVLDSSALSLSSSMNTTGASNSTSSSSSSSSSMDPPRYASSSSSSSSSSSHNNNNNPSLQDMVNRLLQIPPYSTRLHLLESNIASAHRRIREQLASLGVSTIEPQVLSTASTHLESP